MKLVENWRRVIAFSLSFWMQAVGLLVLILPEVWFYLTGQDYDPLLAWSVGVLLLFFGLFGRLFQQSNSVIREWLRIGAVVILAIGIAFAWSSRASAAGVTEAETLEIAVPYIAVEEGKRNKSYRDIVGVWTICYGSTRGIGPGMVMTDAECLDLLRDEVAEYRHGLHAYFTPSTKTDRLTPARDAAYTSLAFNCGIRAIGRSTATRRLNSGNIRGGCKALTWWNKAGGRVIRGLVNRRAREQTLCLQGL